MNMYINIVFTQDTADMITTFIKFFFYINNKKIFFSCHTCAFIVFTSHQHNIYTADIFFFLI